MNACGFDMMRVGIALYGLQPTPGKIENILLLFERFFFVLERNMLPNEIEPALSWYATVAQIRKVPKKGTGSKQNRIISFCVKNNFSSTI